MKKISLIVIGLLFSFTGYSQSGGSSATEILHSLKKLQNPTRVLYLAAHPDDENTKMIAWLVNGVGANTAYLSLTRGDGGQNLIGTELSEELGVLRTQELMQARKIDGGKQFFSRAVDFGYSKSSSETFKKWGKEEILSDVVWVIRKFRPDVIITRFPPDSRGGHGHHTASAILGMEAFDLAADPNAFPEQLEYTDTWQPKRIYWNASHWWNKDLPKLAKSNEDYVSMDVGGYNALLGASYNEIASYSRTQHKSQGFGVSVARGSSVEYLKYLKGDKAVDDIFSGINQSWERYGFADGDKMLGEIISHFDPSHPAKSVNALFALRDKADAISDITQRRDFKEQLDQIILKSMGWHAELLAESEFFTQNSVQDVKLVLISRTSPEVSLQKLEIAGETIDLSEELSQNEIYEKEIDITVSSGKSQPYWLEKPAENLFVVNDQQLIGLAENGAAIAGKLHFLVNGKAQAIEVPVYHKYSDRVEGEIIDPVFVVPELTVNPDKENMIFVENEAQIVELEILFFNEESATLHFSAKGWKIEPSQIEVTPKEGNNFASLQLEVLPLGNSQSSRLEVQINDGKEAYALSKIGYGHIENRLVFEPAVVNLIKIDLKSEGGKVGYIPGAGDKVAEAIAQMGYDIDFLTEEMIRNDDLSQYKTIVAGIRAYNTREWLPSVKHILMKYVENGGNYIVQYNTASRDLLSDDIGPYSFEISRERVTEEDAEAKFLLPQHPVFNTPNNLSGKDFEGWVQERGLYFADKWSGKYVAPIGWHDEGEPVRAGGLLIAHHGKGSFIYTGISFFRELPAGVPGAYRLLANLISYTNSSKDEQ